MDFKTIPTKYHPAYTWLWNTTITKEGIASRIDEMYDAGIRAFYVLGEPENFRPTMRRTHLSPDYLSDEYVELVYFAYEYGRSKGMYSWLYNEGGFPSGFAGGLVREKDPSLGKRALSQRPVVVKAGEPYAPEVDIETVGTFVGKVKIEVGTTFDVDTEVIEYRNVEGDAPRCTLTDNALHENVDIFLEVTHERLKKRFGDAMGSDVTLMFDDEASMANWSNGLEKKFFDRYGYDLTDFLPFIVNRIQPETEAEYRAKIDYTMLCGDLVHDNYFMPMKEWCNAHNMESVGHLNNENKTEGTRLDRYGNMMRQLRAFDVPGIDVIWSQIWYPNERGDCCTDNPPYTYGNFEFFPRLASSAARQIGQSKVMSETFAVFGSHVTPEDMRFAVNYQAVRGINLFNFMVMSYDRETAMSLQYRPNFIPTHPGMDMLAQINDYTARLSYILQSSKPDVTTALYYPLRTISAGGKIGKEAEEYFKELGEALEKEGVDFDVIDEEIVQKATLDGMTLVYGDLRYDNVFTPEASFELDEVVGKLSACACRVVPTVGRSNGRISARKLGFADGTVGYFVASSAGETVSDVISIECDMIPYAVDLYTGELCEIEHTRVGGSVEIPLTLLRGEAAMIVFSPTLDESARPIRRAVESSTVTLGEVSGYVSRLYTLDKYNAPHNDYFTEADGETLDGLCGMDITYSGEATYTVKVTEIPTGEGHVVLDLGEVHHFARVSLNGRLIGEVTMPPYTIDLTAHDTIVQVGDELQIVVANTISNVCHRAKFFETTPSYYVGTYHKDMRIHEEEHSVAGGLFGPVTLYNVK